MSSLDENLERLRRKVDVRIERLLSARETPTVRTMSPPVADATQAIITMPIAPPIANVRSDHQRPNYRARDWQEGEPAQAAPSTLPIASHPGFFANLRVWLGFAQAH